MAGALLTLLCGGLVALLATPPFMPADESGHAGYALEVVDGDLPTTDEMVEVELPGQKPTRMFVANHPPLYYVLVGPVLAWGRDSDHAYAGIRLAKGFSLALAGGTVVGAAAMAGVLVRRRRAEAMVLTAGLTATVPTLVFTSTAVHNDLLAVFAGVVAYSAALAALVSGPRRSHVLLVCLGAAVTMATRFSGLGVVLLAAAGLGAAFLFHNAGSWRRRLGAGVLFGAAPLVSALVAAGWYYQRNKRLYGDYAGINDNIEFLQRADRYTLVGYLTDRLSLPDLLTRMEGGGGWRGTPYFGWYDRKLLAVVVAAVALGALLRAAGGLRSWIVSRREGRTPARPLDDLPITVRLTVVTMLLGLPLLLWVQLAGFVSQTGAPHPRYMFAAIPVLALLIALALLGFPRRLAGLVGTAIVAFQVVLIVTTTGRFVSRRLGAPPANPLRQVRDALEHAGIPNPWLALGLLGTGAAAGIALQLVAVWKPAEVQLAAAGPGVLDLSADSADSADSGGATGANGADGTGPTLPQVSVPST
ncbi:MAG TPA: hypothetical protein VK611_04705 [Acidimicrobiales bacterium]|nr:hypothetical protein [Acidimicrobiales bacterium]